MEGGGCLTGAVPVTDPRGGRGGWVGVSYWGSSYDRPPRWTGWVGVSYWGSSCDRPPRWTGWVGGWVYLTGAVPVTDPRGGQMSYTVSITVCGMSYTVSITVSWMSYTKYHCVRDVLHCKYHCERDVLNCGRGMSYNKYHCVRDVLQ